MLIEIFCRRLNILGLLLSFMNVLHIPIIEPHNLISIFFQPGDAKSVTLVSIGGHRVIRGGNGIGDGPIDSSQINEVMQKVNSNNFGHEDYPDARFVLSYLIVDP